ncbi:unnamed protein product [Commensalibacter papalotli (ex Botero et al. 2024)]|uniref:DUF3885 domain-containing protein n=2 Tax=Commensalibacter papalotli (ex Botero et al. 2024) TaxID=2972766 RepID=A0ABN8WIV1_9PROT|nr:hypothetical protein [Commensalibacter papalotli (ex Botero et al. 2024)]CAI3957432.1 unnamed protein product [Commensalibacter papalotli (ex Botero et al. 2024)]CAI3958067.1 unnamed protein product [Commensalibacter papalotli (ex Botero et al. 2024)]
MIEIRGKDGGALQFEMNDTGNIKNIFYYNSDDIFFMFKSNDGNAINLSIFRSDLKTLLNDKSKARINETLNSKVDSWFMKQFKNKFSFCFTKSPKAIDSYCLGVHLTDFAFLTCKRIENSLNYLFKFLFYDPYYIPTDDGNNDDNFYIDDGDDTLVLEGSLLVSEEALIIFYQELVSL